MAAPKTVKTYPLNGSTRDFEIPFEYLARKFVQVTLVGSDRKLLVLNIDYRFTQRTIITLTKNWGPNDGYEMVELRRMTSATERLVDFSDGSILRAYDLNTATVQSLHIAEEGRDIATDTIGVDNNGNLDARGRKIVNLADATSPGDAVSLRQLQGWNESALESANRASTAAAAAKNSENFAAASRSGAAASEVKAKDSETAAKSSETASKASEVLAKDWANKLGLPVANGEWSARYYTMLSQQAQQMAYTARDAALVSQQAAKVSETNAANSEANLGNAVSLYGNVESVTGTTIKWKPNVTTVYTSGSAVMTIDGYGLDSKSGIQMRSMGNTRLVSANSVLAISGPAAYPGLTIQGSVVTNIGKLEFAGVSGTLSMKTTSATATASAELRIDGSFVAAKFRVGGLKVPAVWETPWERFSTYYSAKTWKMPHPFGVVPHAINRILRCDVSQANAAYVAGDIVVETVSVYGAANGTTHNGDTATVTAEEITFVASQGNQTINNKDTGVAVTLVQANWSVMFVVTAAI